MHKCFAPGYVLVLWLTAAQFALAQELVIENAWARANPPVVPNSAVYLTIQNRGAAADRLLHVESEVAKMLEIHHTLTENNMTTMKAMHEGVPVPAGSAVVLAPGGLHIMLMGLAQALAGGDTFRLDLHFEKAGPLSVEVEVREPGS